MIDCRTLGPSPSGRSSSRPGPFPAVSILLAAWVGCTASFAAEPETEPQPQSRSEQPHWLHARAGHIAFETFGRDSSLTHVELMPVLRGDKSLLFGDVRFFGTNEGYFGGNVGAGYRWYVPASDRFWGGSVWYDIDDTTGELFHQVGLGLETYGQVWDIRSNFYFPICNTEREYGRVVRDRRFAGNRILYDYSRELGEAMPGVDFEYGLLLPWEAAQTHNVRAYAGAYFFAGDTADDIVGFKARLEGYVINNVAVQTELTDDDTFGTHITLGVAITLPGGMMRGGTKKAPLWNRPLPFVQRNYNVIVSRTSDLHTGLTAVNPQTGQPYVVQHVSTTSPAGANLGTAENPFTGITDAQAAPADILFVHAGSVLTDAVVLQEGDRILGEGVNHSFALAGFGNVLLPRATAGIDRPTIRDVVGDAVTLASHSEFSGFLVENPTGHGIVGRQVNDFVVSNTDVRNTAGDGIFLQDAGGNIPLDKIAIRDTAGSALHIQGGDLNARVSGTIDNAAGHALLLEDTTGGSVDLSRTAINDHGGEGVLIDGISGKAILGDIAVRNSTAAGVEVRDSSGAVEFQGATLVQNAAGAGVVIDGAAGPVSFQSLQVAANGAGPGVRIVDSPAKVSIQKLDLTSNNAAALEVRNSGTTTVAAGTIAAVNGAAVDLEKTTMDVSLTSVSSSGAAYGLRIVDSAGQFLVLGKDVHGSGGVIRNAGTGVLIAGSGTVGLRYLDLNGNATAVDVSKTQYLALAGARVTGSLDYAIRSLNTTKLGVTDSIFTDNGGAGRNTVLAAADAPGTYTLALIGNNITDATDAAIAVANSGAGSGSTLMLAVQENELTSVRAGASAVALDWNGAVQATIAENIFAASGGSNRAIDFTSRSATDLLSVTATGNEMSFAGGNDVAFRFNTLGPSSLTLVKNTLDFRAANGIGMDFSLAPSAIVNLESNRITDRVAGATGILFRSVAGPSSFTINDNTIDLLGAAYVVDQGIIFSTMTGTSQLQCNRDNVVNGASIPFSVPLGSTSGFIRINGSAMP